MANLRWYRGSEADPPVVPKLRWYRGEVAGTVPTTSKIRWYRGDVAGSTAVIVNAIASQSGVEPESTVTISATLVGGGTADSWTWRRVSGAAVGITGTGATVVVVAPSDINGTTVTIGVRATKDSTISPEVTFTMGVLPQTEWWWSGAGWVPHVEEFEPAGFGTEPFGFGYFGGA